MSKRLPDRFYDKVSVEPNTGCFLWTAAVDKDGYGRFFLDGKTRRAHRVAFDAENGFLKSDLVIDHLCRTPSCVNPDHLELVTNKENVLLGVGFVAKNAKKTHCPKGHVLGDANLYVSPGGSRSCRECFRERDRKRWAKHKKELRIGPRNQFKTHCKRGHEYTEENTYRRSNGSRECRICIATRERKRVRSWKKC